MVLGALAPLALAMSLPATLYDMPVSNHGARVRLLLYKKGLTSADVAVVPPTELGGLRSDEYLALNPQGKMPLLVDGPSVVYETDAICRHLLDKFHGKGASLMPPTLAGRTASEVLCRVHDAYLGPIQGCLYKPAPPFGRFGTRTEALRELAEQLRVVEGLADAEGPYLCGAEFSLADATLFPTMLFVTHMLPKFDDAASSLGHFLGPRLQAWWAHMSTQDAEAMKVAEEIRGGFTGWEERGRWDTIMGAGVRDTAPPTLFDKILAKEIPSEVVYEDETCLAFKDINPAAPTHILLIPKEREGLSGLGAATAEHTATLGRMMVAAAEVARQQGLDDFRLVSNNGESACQSVFHLHLHIIGGRPLSWPPG